MEKQKKEIQIEWKMSDWKKVVNTSFLPLIDNEDRYLILVGGRGSSKSRFIATKLIYRMLTENYFRCILVRNVAATIKDSSYQMILDVISDLGLDELFTHTVSPLTITCLNGNKIMARGMDNPTGVKSISDVSCVWYEEDIIDEDAWITVSTSVRTTKSRYIQEIFTINPEVDGGHFSDNWFYKRFFAANQQQLSFKNKTSIPGRNGKQIEFGYTVHHSTYKDNRFLSEQYIATLLNLKKTNPYYFTIYVEGLWGAKINSQAFYKSFVRGKHTTDTITYNPSLPLHIAIDFNVVPHCSAVVCQIDGRKLSVIEEIATKTPYNTTKGICQQILIKYCEHDSGLFIYGDSTGFHNDTRNEKGVNDFTIIQGYLKELSPILRVPSKNPPVVTRGQFINDIFDGQKDIEIEINDTCIHLITDFLFGKEAEDGTKLKEKIKKDGITYEKYFHMADAFDYIVCEAFKKDFTKQKNGGKKFNYTVGKKPLNDKFFY